MELSSLHARAGLKSLGKYRSSNPRWEGARRKLSQPVTKAAVDRGIERRLGDQAAELIVGKDNRSVTSPQWVAEGLSRYGCPIHTTKSSFTGDGDDQFTVSGIGVCSCRREDGNSRGAQPGMDGTGPANGGSRSSPAPLSRMLGPVHESTRSKDGGGSLSGRKSGSPPEVRAGRPWDSGAYRDAFRATLAVAGDESGGREPYSLDEVVARFIHRGNYAGAPYFCSNREVLDKGLGAARRIWTGDRGFDPYLFGRRVQPGPSGPKTRLVWMAPLATSIVGASFSKRVHQNLARKRPFAIGLRSIEKGALVAELQSRFRYVYSIDYSSYDASAPAFMLDDVFRVLRTHLCLTDDERTVWERYVSDFIHSRIIVPDGTIFQKHKGIPSGSMFTTLVGSVLNLLVMNYVWIRATGAAPKQDRLLIQGDDVIIASDTRVSLGDLASYAAELGFVVSAEKSSVTDSYREAPDPFTNRVHFLGHYWHNGWPHRPKHEILQRMVFTERHKLRTDKESVLRLYAYLTDAWEAWDIYTRVYPAEDSFTSLTRCLDELEGHEVDIGAVDLPGQLRFYAAVIKEVGEDPVSVRGLALGTLPLIF